jgi:hypothetical protein
MNPTFLKLKEMKLKVMAQMMDEPDSALRDLSFEERFGLMVEKEWLSRKNGKFKRQLYSASLEIAEGRYNKASTVNSDICRTLNGTIYSRISRQPSIYVLDPNKLENC